MRLVKRAVVSLGFCFLLSSAVFAWGPGKHQELAGMFYNDPLIAGFASEFGTNVSDVTSGADDLDFASSDHKSKYHDGQWTMVTAREYVNTPASPSDWFDLDETTRLKYMMHNLGDVAVPIGHSPANSYPGAEPNQPKEFIFEVLQADAGTFGNPSAPTGGWYTGTVSQCIDQYYTEHMANVAYFAANVSGLSLPANNANASAHTAWAVSQKLAKVILADYYLAKRSAADGAAQDITVGPGQSAMFTAADLRDPDNIKWNGDGTYYYDGTWTGISQTRWDIDGDGNYETTGLEASRTYAQLVGMFGANAIVTFGLEIVDDEGNVTHDTGTLTLVPEPATLLLTTVGMILLPLRKKRS